MKRVWWQVAPLLLVILILNDKLPHRVALFGWVPDVALVGLLFITLRFGPQVGVWSGFAAGLFLDVATPEGLGARALSLSIACFAVGRSAVHVDVGSGIVQLVLLLMMGLVDAVVFESVRHITEPGVGVQLFFVQHVPSLVYTLLIAAVVFRLLGGQLRPSRATWRNVR